MLLFLGQLENKAMVPMRSMMNDEIKLSLVTHVMCVVRSFLPSVAGVVSFRPDSQQNLALLTTLINIPKWKYNWLGNTWHNWKSLGEISGLSKGVNLHVGAKSKETDTRSNDSLQHSSLPFKHQHLGGTFQCIAWSITPCAEFARDNVRYQIATAGRNELILDYIWKTKSKFATDGSLRNKCT
jgi:hypothetical protein